MTLKRCVKCGHETTEKIASVACIDGAYHSWEPTVYTRSVEADPEAFTPCWNCPRPTCLNPPRTCARRYGFAAERATV